MTPREQRLEAALRGAIEELMALAVETRSEKHLAWVLATVSDCRDVLEESPIEEEYRP